MPLITKADGTKFGKTESGTIWLEASKTSPYAFYQFWLGTADADVYKFLRYFTFLPVEQIARIEEEDKAAQGRPQAQAVLAEEVTRLVHGQEGLDAALRITEALFSGSLSDLSADDLAQLAQDGLPTTNVTRGDLPATLTQLLSDVDAVASGKQAKDALSRSAVTVNGAALGMDVNANPEAWFPVGSALAGKFYLVKVGKKKHHLFVISGG
jgi:tyrosyl-tRNA synthetase